MQYKDLVQYEPIESIIKLTDANEETHAKNKKKTYVISERMAEQLNDFIIEHLQFSRARENMGLFIVGNYGTGKSHLMSVISTIAERENASQYISNPSVAEKAKEIELFRFIFALSIPEVGLKTARELAKQFGTLENLMNAKEEDLAQIRDIGEVIAKNIFLIFSASSTC